MIEESEMELYPNPTTGMLSIRVSDANEILNIPAKILVTDVLGRIIFMKETTIDENSVFIKPG